MGVTPEERRGEKQNEEDKKNPRSWL